MAARSLQELLAAWFAVGRICPQPSPWHTLWEMLPGRERRGAGWSPPAPLILGAWWEATDADKAERFRLHLAWAERHGVLDQALDFLESLAPSDWHTRS